MLAIQNSFKAYINEIYIEHGFSALPLRNIEIHYLCSFFAKNMLNVVYRNYNSILGYKFKLQNYLSKHFESNKELCLDLPYISYSFSAI